MSKSSALATLLELAQTRTDDAAKRLGALHTQGVHMEAKLQLLLQYRDDYCARFQALMQQGLTASDWRNYQEFLDKLDDAITQQHEALASAQQRVAAGRAAWQSAKRTFNSYDTLAQRGMRAELLRTIKREQQETDEHAGNTTARKKMPR
ncbi:flagellar export protein FliJ [Nitrosovibrio sp. Nv6]|uniref:flagellar export protein FliJ n=1 Tax=Nitrosovibrio sp. Nv6 TaxID=1855340 RepID=UPI0008C484A9|nr:flagellar export protein FliJ [Nitrosovibrio sp. Nv6]SEO49009.1 flagellar FliJ protein [Nitrosovibrio sp. Nv6]